MAFHMRERHGDERRPRQLVADPAAAPGSILKARRCPACGGTFADVGRHLKAGCIATTTNTRKGAFHKKKSIRTKRKS